jgi:hypothetical protein
MAAIFVLSTTLNQKTDISIAYHLAIISRPEERENLASSLRFPGAPCAGSFQ